VSDEKTGRAGLRERKKLATRQALSWAALHLTVERGLENVRVEDIAAAAGVSPRTFNNYFSSKEEAIVAIGVDRAASAATAMRARPAGEPFWDALIGAVVEQFAGHEDPDQAFVARVRLVMKTPALLGEYLKSGLSIARSLADAIAERTGTDAELDLYPRLVADIAVATEQAVIDHWLNSGAATPLAEVLRHALRQVAAGLPAPIPTRKEVQ
jgi:AcrR family transcriptional regulator